MKRKRRSYEEIRDIFYQIKGIGYSDFCECDMPFFLKWMEVLSMKIYPNLPINSNYLNYCLNEKGEFVDKEGDPSSEDEEFIYQYGVACSYMTDSVLKYFKASPFWNYDCEEIAVVNDYLDERYYRYQGYNPFPHENNGKPMYPKNFMDKELRTRDDKNPREVIEKDFQFYDYEEYAMIRCDLIDEIEKALSICLTFEDEQIHKDLECALAVINGWMCGEELSFLFPGVAYFLCMDSFESRCQGYGTGCLDFSITMMVAAEFIEAILLDVDAITPFLSDKVRKGLMNVIV